MIVAIFRQQRDIGPYVFEPFLDEITGALVQNPELAEREIVEITATLDERVAFDRPRPWLQNFLRPGLAPAAAAIEYAMLAFDDLDRKILEIEFLAAADARQLRFIDSGGQSDIDCRSRSDDFRTEASGDERNVGDVIGMAMAGENEIRFLDIPEHFLFVGFPLFAC